MRGTTILWGGLIGFVLSAMGNGCASQSDDTRIFEIIAMQNGHLTDAFHHESRQIQLDMELEDGSTFFRFKPLEPAFSFNAQRTSKLLSQLKTLDSAIPNLDSLKSLSEEWELTTMELRNLGCTPDIDPRFCKEWQDSFPNPVLPLIQADLEDAEVRSHEIEIARAMVLDEGITRMEMIRRWITPFCNFGNEDTMMLAAIPAATSTTVGDTAKVTILLAKHLNRYSMEFSGSHPIRPNANHSAATMEIPTSEAMIPPGQSSAEVPYSATVKVPMADGSMREMRLVGKIPITRPCE